MSKPAKNATGRSAPKRREEVLDAAARVFHEKGYDATTIQDIADEVGILKGSVYYYISSKEDVLFEMLVDVHAAALQAVRDAVERDGDAVQKIGAFVETLARFNADNKIRMGILLHDFRSLSEARRADIVRDRDLYDRMLRALIVEGQADGTVNPDIDPKLAVFAVMGMINTIYQWYKPAGRQRPQHIGTSYAELVIRALAVTPEAYIGGPELSAAAP
jgi:AcrR family transcriptional regulator